MRSRLIGPALVIVLTAAASLAAQTATSPDKAHRLHGDPKAYVAALEDPKRDAYQKPHEVIEALAIKEGEVIADIGAGSGYFSFRLAHHAGKGRIYAVDISPDMILAVNRRIRDTRATNVVSVLAPPDDPLLPLGSIDRFFFCNVWHHIEDQPKYLALVKQMLKPGGQVVMIDFHKKDLPVGPPADMKIAREDLLRQMEQNGFALLEEHAFLPYQYFLVFRVKGS
jgi:ubiquinone/menaquinone biosynthesis C-methylase UbiE